MYVVGFGNRVEVSTRCKNAVHTSQGHVGHRAVGPHRGQVRLVWFTAGGVHVLHRVQVARLRVGRHVLHRVAARTRELSRVQQRIARIARVVRRDRAFVGHVQPVADGVELDHPCAAGIADDGVLRYRQVGEAEYAVGRIRLADAVVVLLRPSVGNGRRPQVPGQRGGGDCYYCGGDRECQPVGAGGPTEDCGPPPPRYISSGGHSGCIIRLPRARSRRLRMNSGPCAVGGQKGADARGLGARHGCGGQAGDRRIRPFRTAAKRATRAGTVLRGPARCRARGIPCRPRRHAGRRRGRRHGGSQRLAGPAGGRRSGFPLPAAVPREGRRHAEGGLRAAGRHGLDRPRV